MTLIKDEKLERINFGEAFYYQLVGDDVVACSNWDGFVKTIMNRWQLKTKVGGKFVSTVFLALDHRFGNGPPLLFETMTFPDQNICVRYETKERAVAGHAVIVWGLRNTAFGMIKKANRTRREYRGKRIRDTRGHRRTHRTGQTVFLEG